MKTPAERLAEKLPPEGQRRLDARLEEARAAAKLKGRDVTIYVGYTVDEYGQIFMDVPQRHGRREVG